MDGSAIRPYHHEIASGMLKFVRGVKTTVQRQLGTNRGLRDDDE